jgi:3-oxosteroid 1-dehydrogenase
VINSMGAPQRWDEEVDFVVLGSGGAGLTAAVTAASEGLSVALLEKSGLIGGTTAISGGGFWIPLNRHMSEVGVEDNREDALAYVRACASGAGDDATLAALIDGGAQAVDYLEDRAGCEFRAWPGPPGGMIDYRPWLPGSRHGGRTLDAGRFPLASLGKWEDKLRRGVLTPWRMDKLVAYSEQHHILPPDPNRASYLGGADAPYDHAACGGALVGQLLRAAVDLGVRIHLDTPGKELVVEDGVVVGVRATAAGALFAVRSRRGVLVATGGYTSNEELKRLWMDRPIEYSFEVEENEGDGHLMGMAVGAQVAGLGDAWWMMQGAGHVNRYVPHTMIVNKHGRRFCNEAVNYYDFGFKFGTKRDSPDGQPENLPAWLLMDAQGPRKYSVLSDIPGQVVEVADRVAAGALAIGTGMTVIAADTLPELADKLGIDAVELSHTVQRFNQYAKEGIDPDFHRGEDDWAIAWGDPANKPNPSLGPLEEGPFYAVEIASGALATRGGLRVNAHAQVLAAATGEPMPGLYAAGNASDGVTPLSYPGAGATIGAAIAFGYLAAMHAAGNA